MKGLLNTFLTGALLVGVLNFSPMTSASATSSTVRDLSSAQMLEIVRMARLIAFTQPNLHSTKYFEYGYGILMASQTYGIDPILLISIIHQETSFRENLPTGKAGEIGIAQIRKAWLKNPLFVREFGSLKANHLKDPIRAFTYAAWILKDLKSIERPSRTLPFWCYYNSKQFENRLKYFLSVNRNIVNLRKNDPDLSDRSLASVKAFARTSRSKAYIARSSKRYAPYRASVAD